MSLTKQHNALAAAMLVLAAGLCLGTIGCKAEPVAADGCKKIEAARCRAIASCPGYQKLDVEACIRFYDDHCLHGLATESDPGEPRVEQCAGQIASWGACAKDSPDQCPDACGYLEAPEKHEYCNFLSPPAAVDAGTADSATASDSASDAAATD